MPARFVDAGCRGVFLLALGLLGAAGALPSSMAREDDSSPAARAAAALPTDPATTAPEPAVIVRLYYGDRERLAQLVSEHDVFEYANHAEGYVMARLGRSEFATLAEGGLRLEIDAEQTALANRRLGPRLAGQTGIPSYPCYRTVEETYARLAEIASDHPHVASLVTVGQSWEKGNSGGRSGYDLLALVLSNRARTGPKSRLLLVAEHHARELTTAETALRFAEELVGQYEADPEVTWMLDHSEVHILAMANPDGRIWAEQGYWWRKNTDNTNGCATFPNYGTDLNRNCGFTWGGIGSSAAPCNDLYRGPGAFSEPENQAIRDYARSLFQPQRGPGIGDPAPVTATGLLISLHSFGQLVLHPWGHVPDAAPNAAGLQTLGGKFGFYNRYVVQPSYQLYPTSGTLDEWAYGELGIAAYTIEMGTEFFESCAEFENRIYPSNRLALRYACKAARRPYADPAGPDVIEVAVSDATHLAGAWIPLTATAEAGRTYGTTLPIPRRPIAAARYSVDDPSWIEGVVTHALSAIDGSYNFPVEAIGATLDTAGWAPGRHTVFVEAQDTAGNWGVPTAVFVWIAPLTLAGETGADGFVLRWPSVAGRSYSVLKAENSQAGFTVLASGLPGRPPHNAFVDATAGVTQRYFQVRMDP